MNTERLRCIVSGLNRYELNFPPRLTFWTTVRSLRDLPLGDLTVKGGKYIVQM